MKPRLAFGVFVTILFLILLLLPSVYAATTISLFGPPPSEKEIEFKPNLHKELDFKVVSSASSIRTYLNVPDTIKPYVKLVDNAQFTGSREFKVILDLPSSLPPGIYDFLVGAITSKSETSGEGLGVNTAVQLRFFIVVYYDEKVISAELFPKDTVNGGKAELDVEVRSWTKQDIKNVYAELYVKDTNTGKIFGPIMSNAKFLKAKDKVTLTAFFDTSLFNVSQGTFEVSGKVHYDGLIYNIPENKTFKVGDLVLSLQNYDRFIRPGTYNKLVFVVKNEWNEPAENVYLELPFGDETLKSVPKTIRPFSTENFEIFIDGQGLEVGQVFNLPLKIVYADNSWTYNITLRVEEAPKEEPKKENNSIFAQPILVLVLIIMFLLFLTNIFVLIYLLRHNKKEEK